MGEVTWKDVLLRDATGGEHDFYTPGENPDIDQAFFRFEDEVLAAWEDFIETRIGKGIFIDGVILPDEEEIISDTYMSLIGAGAGLWDGEYDFLFTNGNNGSDALHSHMVRRVSSYLDDTGGGSLVAAIMNALYDYEGGE